MPTLDYRVTVRDRIGQELTAELLEFGLAHNAIRTPRARARAEELLRELARQLLSRKRLSPSDEERIRTRWGRYVNESKQEEAS